MTNKALYRYHYDVYRNTALVAGEHNVTFVLDSKEREGTAQLCNVEVLEFGNEDEWVSSVPASRPDANTSPQIYCRPGLLRHIPHVALLYRRT